MTNYDEKFEGVNVIYDKPNLQMTFGEVISKTGRTQLRIAETEKYPTLLSSSTVEEKCLLKVKLD